MINSNLWSEDDSAINKITHVAAKRQTVGWAEDILLTPENLLIETKLAPGSEGNVIHADNITTFKKNDEKWVKFDIEDQKGQKKQIEKKIITTTKYKISETKAKKRYTVQFGVCISNKFLYMDFALTDRSSYDQPARIGRDMLAGHFVIDPAKTKTTVPLCKNIKTQDDLQ